MAGALAEILGDDESRELFALTDEELTALGPLRSAPAPANRPYLATIPAAERDRAVSTALRSLVARGLVTILDPDEVDAAVAAGGPDAVGDLAVGLDPVLDAVLGARIEAGRSVSSRRYTEHVLDAYFYVAKDHVAADHVAADDVARGGGPVLVEEVTGGGMHTFRLLSAPAGPAALAEMIDPFGSAHEAGSTALVDARAAAAGHLGELAPIAWAATAASQTVVLLADGRPGSGRLIAGYAGPDGLWVLDVAGPGRVEKIPMRTVSPDGLDALAGELLGG